MPRSLAAAGSHMNKNEDSAKTGEKPVHETGYGAVVNRKFIQKRRKAITVEPL